jgi:hypothetical protein
MESTQHDLNFKLSMWSDTIRYWNCRFIMPLATLYRFLLIILHNILPNTLLSISIQYGLVSRCQQVVSISTRSSTFLGTFHTHNPISQNSTVLLSAIFGFFNFCPARL